jgi:hypothetical protein
MTIHREYGIGLFLTVAAAAFLSFGYPSTAVFVAGCGILMFIDILRRL